MPDARFTGLSAKEHTLSITGVLRDAATGFGAAGAEIVLSAMPNSLQRKLDLKALQYGSAWSKLPTRPDRIKSRTDGSFCFMDLPSGDYTVSASVPNLGQRYAAVSQTVEVKGFTSRSTDGTAAHPPFLELLLAPTGVRGTVRVQLETELEPLGMTHVQVKGSGESTDSNSQGIFALHGIEPGRRILTFRATGYSNYELEVVLAVGTMLEVSVILEPTMGT